MNFYHTENFPYELTIIYYLNVFLYRHDNVDELQTCEKREAFSSYGQRSFLPSTQQIRGQLRTLATERCNCLIQISMNLLTRVWKLNIAESNYTS